MSEEEYFSKAHVTWLAALQTNDQSLKNKALIVLIDASKKLQTKYARQKNEELREQRRKFDEYRAYA